MKVIFILKRTKEAYSHMAWAEFGGRLRWKTEAAEDIKEGWRRGGHRLLKDTAELTGGGGCARADGGGAGQGG